MGLFKRLLHRHTWRRVRKEYSCWDYSIGRYVTVYRCQCRICNKIDYLPFNGKELLKR